VLIIVLWVRSYTWRDGLWGRFSDLQGFALSSYEGRIQLAMEWGIGIFPWRIVSAEPVERNGPPIYFPAVEFPLSRKGLYFAMPYWLLLAVFSILAIVPWFRYRFSLRTLLVAMTLVAVVLGFIVYAAMK
jgi:hypothetical protein